MFANGLAGPWCGRHLNNVAEPAGAGPGASGADPPGRIQTVWCRPRATAGPTPVPEGGTWAMAVTWTWPWRRTTRLTVPSACPTSDVCLLTTARPRGPTRSLVTVTRRLDWPARASVFRLVEAGP